MKTKISWLNDKVTFLIETMEHFIDFQSMRETIIKQANENAIKVLGAPSDFQVEFIDEEIWLILICSLTVKWAISHNIGPHILLDQMREVTEILYTLDVKDRIEAIMRGQDPTKPKDKLDGYES